MKKLSARSRHVVVFLGAGASHACGLPTIDGLRDAALELIDPAYREKARQLFEGRSLEDGLSRLRRMRAFAGDDAVSGVLTSEELTQIDSSLCSGIVDILDDKDVDLAPYIRLGAWVNSQQYSMPIEIFTVNYDLLLERGLEHELVLFFDGFVGTIEAGFRADLVDRIGENGEGDLPASCARVWKLHGSVHWAYREPSSSIGQVVRLGSASKSAAAIFPSEDKYEDSRRVPFVVLFDRLRRALETPETFTIVNGYSFKDQHLNDILFSAARQNPRSELWVTCFGDIPQRLEDEAQKYKNISIYSRTRAIVGGRGYNWEGGDIPHIFKDGQLLLGDFGELTRLLLAEVTEGDGG